MRRNVLSILILVLVVLASAPFSAYALAGHTATISASTNVSCNGGNDGSATATVSGGTGPFGYEWTPGNIIGATASGLTAGSYTVTVTDSSDMSIATATVTISQPTPISISLNVTNVNCYGACNGAISPTVNGGTPPYTYSWSPIGITTATATGLCAGTYTLTVMDNNGCIATTTTTVTEPGPLAANPSVTSTTCNSVCNGTAGTNPTGGTPPYTYLWSGGQTTQSISSLCAGSYTVTVTDNIGCTDVQAVTVVQPPVLSVSASALPETCAGANNGQATANPSGGTPPYSYSWTPVAGNTASISNLAPGTYTVTVTDSNGCTANATATVGSPVPLSISPSTIPACFASCDGSVAAAVSGGTAPYSYLWQPGNQTTSMITNACPGNYTVTITDAMGCIATATITLTSNPQINPVATATPSIICSGGTSQLQVTGGIAYTWTPSSTLNASNISNPIAAPLFSTTYTVVVTDATGCSEATSVTVAVNPSPTVSMSSTYTSCSGSNGTATATPTGNPPFTYAWSTGATTQTIIGLPVNTYSVSVTDAGGCTVTDSVTVRDSCGWVWPGDANEDLVANNTDILAIGLGYGFTGSIRNNATLNWTGQFAMDWNDTLPDGTNLKYTDCNGDGVIDYNDTIAVTQNYGLTHIYRLTEPIYSLSNPNLYLVASMDSAGPQTLVNIDIMLGEAAMPVDSIYGIAYTLTFDPTLIDTNASYISYTGSWLGTVGTDMIPFTKYFNTSGFVDAAVVGIDHMNRSGYGKIGTFRIVTTDNLSGIVPLNIGVSNVTAITARMAMLTVNTQDGAIILDPSLSTGITYSEIEKLVSMYPNPAGTSITFGIPANTVDEMLVTDIAGRIMMKIQQPSQVMKLDVSGLVPGMYQVIMKTSKGNINKKLQVIR